MSKPKPLKPTVTKHVSHHQNQKPQKTEKQPSWAVVRGLLSCKNVQVQQQKPLEKPQPQPQSQSQNQESNDGNNKQAVKKKQQAQRKLQEEENNNSKKCKKMKCSGSLCNNTKITATRPETGTPDIHKRTNNDGSSSRSMKAPLNELNNNNGVNGVVSASSSSLSASSTSSAGGSSFRGMPFRRLSGCYECRMVVDPVLGFTRDPSLRTTICSCPDCGEIMKAESLEHHQAVKHAVSELGPEDTSKNIVEIIFHSSWLKKQTPVCKIDRILKVHNTQRTIGKFEEYRDSIKAKATKLTKKHARCIADGNELLRFHCTTFSCSLGLNGSSNLCNSIPLCNVCSIIKHGFKVTTGILTTATSGRAHDMAGLSPADEGSEKRAMLVCRVIAGRVKKNNAEGGTMDEYDSVAGEVGAYSNLDELYVSNPRAILPCFVVIYRGF